MLLEAPAEIARIRESDLVRGLGNGELAALEIICGLLHTEILNQFYRRLPGKTLYLVVHRSTAHPDIRRKLVYSHFRIRNILIQPCLILLDELFFLISYHNLLRRDLYLS